MQSNNKQIDAYKIKRSLKEHELRMLEKIRDLKGDFDGALLDVGCASGSFLEALRTAFPAARLEGLEISEELIALANERLAGMDVRIHVGDACAFQPPRRYDIIIASGILSVFDDPFPVLETWMNWLADDGRLIVFGRFNSAPIDTRIHYRSRVKPNGWETGLSSYSVDTVREFIESKGGAASFSRFRLPFDLPPTDDPIRTYTALLANGERLVTNGANIVAEHFYLTVSRADCAKTPPA